MKPFSPKFESLEARIVLDAKAAQMIGVEHLGEISWNDKRGFVEVRPQLVSADIDADGLADIVVANHLEVQIFLNDGRDSISTPDLQIPQLRTASQLAISDINGDGLQDIVTFDDFGMHVRMNQSTDQFLDFSDAVTTELPQAELSTFGLHVEFADLNNDGWADMVRGIFQKGTIVSLGRGDGTFEEGIQFSDKWAFSLTNLDNDAYVDLVVHAGFGSDEQGFAPLEHIFLNDGSGFFEFAEEVPRPFPASFLLPNLDLNKDGVADRVGMVEDDSGSPGFSVSLSLGGEPVWLEPAIVSNPLIGGGYAGPAYSDVNDDSETDVILSNQSDWHSRLGNSSGGTMIMLHEGEGQLADPLRISTTIGDIAVGSQLVAISAEGKIEFLRLTEAAFDRATILESRVGRLVRGEEDNFSNRFLPVVTEFIDANNDGHLDIVRVRETVWLNTGEGAFVDAPQLLEGEGGMLLTQRLDAQQPSEPQPTDLPDWLFADGWHKTAVADFNGDGIEDVVDIGSAKSIHSLKFDGSQNDWDGVLSVWLGEADGTYTLSNRISGAGYTFYVNDDNGDGVDDLVVLTHQSEIVSAELIAFQGTSEGLVEQSRKPIPAEVNFVQTADLNGDGAQDAILGSLDLSLTLLVSSQAGYRTQVYEIDQLVDDVFVGDMDHDGKRDVLIAEFGTEIRPAGSCFFCGEVPTFNSPEVKLTTMSAMDDGNFGRSAQTRVEAFNVNAMKVVDLDGDQALDIVLAGNSLAVVWNLALTSEPAFSLNDIHQQCTAIRAEEPSSEFDRNSDGIVDHRDLETLLRVQGKTNLGDANLDGAVNFADFLRLSTNFGSTDAVWEDGDFDCDGEVSFADFLSLSANFGFVGELQAESN